MIVALRGMTVADAPRCAELESVLFPGDDPWTEDAFRSELSARHNHYVVAADDSGRIVGYAGVSLLGRPGAGGEAEVHTIGVDPAAHRGGIGSALLASLLTTADAHGDTVFLEVRTDNEPAITLYRREGFEIIGTRTRYYQPSGADAYTMSRRRGGSA